MSKQKCACGKSGFCERHSKVKMFVILKDEYKSSYKNNTHYSFFKEEKKPAPTIVINMLKRLEPKFKNAYRFIHFYEQQTDQLIHIHKP